jgi:MFS family permease
MAAESRKAEEPGFRNVWYLGIVSLFTDISSEMILGVLPLFVTIDLGATKELLGLMEGAADSLNYAFRSFAGVISDRIASRKPLVIVGYALSTVAKPFFSVASNFTQALVVRLTDRAGKGIRTSPRDALISDSVKEAVSGRAFGLHRSLDQVGAIIGPVLAFFLIPVIGIRNLFIISLVPGSIAVVVLVYFVVDKGGLKKTTSIFKNAGRGSEPKVHRLSDRNRNLRYWGIQLFVRPCEGERSWRRPGHRSTSLCGLERGNCRSWPAVRVAS